MGVAFFGASTRSKAARALAAKSAAYRALALPLMEVATRIIEADLKIVGLTGKKGRDPFWGVTGAAGNALGSRSGHFRRSISVSVFSRDGGAVVVGTVGSPLPQAKLHEEGGEVHGKPWLRIPTAIMQTAAGVDRLAGKSARSLADTRVIKSKTGNLWIAEVGTARSKANVEANGHPLLLYMLVRKIKLRPRRMFEKTLERMRPRIRSLFAGRVTAVVRSA